VPERFTIASFNARWGRSLDDVPFDLGAVVALLDTDLVALQEVWVPRSAPDTVAALAAQLGYDHLHVPLSPSVVDPAPAITPHPHRADGTWGVALLSRLPIRTSRLVDMGRLVERWDVAHRWALLVDVEVGGSDLLSVAAIHLSFALPNAAAQLRRLAGALPGDRASVVVGDCNLWGPVAAGLVPRHERAVRGRTWPAHRPHSQLDHILVTPELAVIASEVLAPAGSDHLPIRATLELRQHP
jgi:endonuclease/exonuclease/phosphatase family metal-dependent hydrolase